MPRVALLPNGVAASCPRMGPLAGEPPKRGVVRGWSLQATRRLRRWFYSVDGRALDGIGYPFTLTVRDLPPSAREWTLTRKRYVQRLRREGMLRGQWLTEWQRRGVPHLHGVAYFPEHLGDFHEALRGQWLASAGVWGAEASGQHVGRLYDLPGWLQYQAKHSARGVRHYQRANAPEAWREGTGRLWGAVGKWPTREELHSVDLDTFHRFRRLMRRWMLSGARREGDWRRVAWLRRMLSDPERDRARVRGIGEFCPEGVSRELLMAAAWGDLEVTEVRDGDDDGC
jgi:hypothetical protein